MVDVDTNADTNPARKHAASCDKVSGFQLEGDPLRRPATPSFESLLRHCAREACIGVAPNQPVTCRQNRICGLQDCAFVCTLSSANRSTHRRRLRTPQPCKVRDRRAAGPGIRDLRRGTQYCKRARSPRGAARGCGAIANGARRQGQRTSWARQRGQAVSAVCTIPRAAHRGVYLRPERPFSVVGSHWW